MKRSLLIILSAFSICLPVTSGADSSDSLYECVEQYLKNRGKLDHRVPATKRLSYCLSQMYTITNTVRDGIETTINNEIPIQKKCLMKQIDNEQLIDSWLHLVHTVHIDKAVHGSDKEIRVESMIKRGQDLIKAIATSCEIAEDELNVMVHVSLSDTKQRVASRGGDVSKIVTKLCEMIPTK